MQSLFQQRIFYSIFSGILQPQNPPNPVISEYRYLFSSINIEIWYKLSHIKILRVIEKVQIRANFTDLAKK